MALFFNGDMNLLNAQQSANLISPAMILKNSSCVNLYLRTRCKVDITQQYFDTSNTFHSVMLYSSLHYGTADWQRVQFNIEPPLNSSDANFVLNLKLVFGNGIIDPFYITSIDLQNSICEPKGNLIVIFVYRHIFNH